MMFLDFRKTAKIVITFWKSSAKCLWVMWIVGALYVHRVVWLMGGNCRRRRKLGCIIYCDPIAELVTEDMNKKHSGFPEVFPGILKRRV